MRGCRGLALGGFFGLDTALFHRVEIGQQKLGIDDVDVVERRHLARHVNHFRIMKAADDMQDGVSLADVREELVAQTFTLAGAFDDARDIDEFHGRRHDRIGLDHGHDAVHARVRHRYHAHIGVDGAERVVGGLRFSRRKGVEDGGLAHIRQADDSDIQRHSFQFLMLPVQACMRLVKNVFLTAAQPQHTVDRVGRAVVGRVVVAHLQLTQQPDAEHLDAAQDQHGGEDEKRCVIVMHGTVSDQFQRDQEGRDEAAHQDSGSADDAEKMQRSGHVFEQKGVWSADRRRPETCG